MKHFTSAKNFHDGHSFVALAMPLHNTAQPAKWPTTACSPREKASVPCSPFLWLVSSRPSSSIARPHHLTTKRRYNAPHNPLHSNTGSLFYPTTEIYQIK
jgi:hypothetical protein